MIDRRCLFSALTEVCASAAARTQVRQRVAHVSCPRAISTSAARANAGRPQRTNEESTSTSTNASTPTESSSVHAGNSAQVESADASASSSSPSDPQSSFGTSTGAVAAAQDRKPLPFLSQPLGVHERPTSTKKSWGEKRAEMLDTDRRIAKRKIIVKEATRGYFHDFHALRSHGGKTWRSPSTLIREDKALYFPDIEGTCLADKSHKHTADMLPGRVSVLSILTSKISEEHTKSFYQPTLDTYQSDPRFQFIQINLQENTLKAYLVSLFLSSLRRQIPSSQHAGYLISQQNLELQREALGLHNKHVGYVYLIGPDSKIRWAGGGFAEEEERKALVSCTGVLLDRAKMGAKGDAPGRAR